MPHPLPRIFARMHLRAHTHRLTHSHARRGEDEKEICSSPDWAPADGRSATVFYSSPDLAPADGESMVYTGPPGTAYGAAPISAVQVQGDATAEEGLAETVATNAFVQRRLTDQIKLHQQYDHDRAQGRLGSTATLGSIVIAYPQESHSDTPGAFYPQENSHSDTPAGAYYYKFPMSPEQFEIENIGQVLAGDATTDFDYAELAASSATLAVMRAMTYRVSAPTPKRYKVCGYLTDVESNLEYFERYVDISQILGWADQKKSKLKFKRDDAVFVFGGDTQDKGIGDIRFVKLLLALKEEHPDRVEFIIGNCAGLW